jgi:hypothetical protein
MSRKTLLSLTVAAVAAVSLVSLASSADARGFGGGGRGMGGGHAFAGHAFAGRAFAGRAVARGPARFHPIRFAHFEHRRHWIFRGGRWIDGGDVVADAPAPAIASNPGPCTCLTKTYTQEGQVVFADICTKETASASVVEKSAAAEPAQNANPNEFAGRTYQDYLAAQKKN